MKTPNPDVHPFVEALRGDLPSAADDARVRARLLAAGVAVTGAALSTSSAAMPFGASSAVAPGAVGAVPGAVASGAAASGAVASGAVVGAPAALVKAGLLSKVLVLPVAAKVGMAATLAVAVAATSVPLVLERDEAATRAHTAPAERAASAADDRIARAASGLVPALPSGGRAEAPAPSEAAAGSGRATAATATASEGAILPPLPPAQSPPRTLPSPGVTAAPQAARSGEPRSGRAASDSNETNGVQRGRRAASVASMPSRRANQAAPVRSSADEDGRTELVSASSLGEETRLMEQAMVALGEGDLPQARRSLEEHARRFPGGLLQRERERGLARLRQTEAGPPATDSSR